MNTSKSQEPNPLLNRDLNRLRRRVWAFLIIGAIGALATAWVGIYKRYNPDPLHVQAERITKDPMALKRHVRINGVDLWIPVGYFESRIPLEVDQKDVLLITLYPEFQPLKQSKQQLWKEGEWYRNVRWLIQDASKMITLERKVESSRKYYDATEYKGVEHGLLHFSQPSGVKNTSEFWFEGESLDAAKSVIQCGKKHSERSRPQCSHYVWDGGLLYDIGFDKELLPHWREIWEKTLALTEQFKRNPYSEINSSNNNKKGP